MCNATDQKNKKQHKNGLSDSYLSIIRIIFLFVNLCINAWFSAHTFCILFSSFFCNFIGRFFYSDQLSITCICPVDTFRQNTIEFSFALIKYFSMVSHTNCGNVIYNWCRTSTDLKKTNFHQVWNGIEAKFDDFTKLLRFHRYESIRLLAHIQTVCSFGWNCDVMYKHKTRLNPMLLCT